MAYLPLAPSAACSAWDDAAGNVCRFRRRLNLAGASDCRRICAARRRTRFGSLPFGPLYRTDTEFAAELSNQTVHGVMHLAWVEQGDGRYQGQMAVYVKPRGRLGQGYMELIKPFRHWIVYPALMRQIERRWNRRGPQQAGR